MFEALRSGQVKILVFWHLGLPPGPRGRALFKKELKTHNKGDPDGQGLTVKADVSSASIGAHIG